jgi:hypothetical protein
MLELAIVVGDDIARGLHAAQGNPVMQAAKAFTRTLCAEQLGDAR